MTDARGFSLLEVLVAVAVTGIAMSVLLSGFSLNLRATGVAADITTATHLARSLVLDAEVGAPIAGRREGDFGSDHPGFSWRIETSEITLGALPAEAPRLWRHEVFVQFARGGRVRTVRLDSLRAVAVPDP